MTFSLRTRSNVSNRAARRWRPLLGLCLGAMVQAANYPVVSCVELFVPPGTSEPVIVGHFGYLNSAMGNPTSGGVTTIPRGITSSNFFTPGLTFITGQPNTFFPGFHSFVFAASHQFTEGIAWILNQGAMKAAFPFSALSNNTPDPPPSAVCPIAPVPKAARFATGGTHQNQLLATVTGDVGILNGTATALMVLGSSGNILVSNLSYTPGAVAFIPGNGASSTAYTPGSVRGDITITGTAPVSGLLVLALNGDTLPGQPVTLPNSNTKAADFKELYVTVPIIFSPGSSASSCAANVTGQTIVTLGGLSQNVITKVWSQTVRVQNTSNYPIDGPVLLALDSLGANATLTNGNGLTSCTTPSGSPYISLGGGLAPSQTAAVTLNFTNAQVGQAITYTPRVLSGGTQQ